MYLIVFDCDGTLVDSQDAIYHGLSHGFDAVGLSVPDRKTALSIVGLSLEQAFLTLVGEDRAHLVGDMAAAYRKAIFARRDAGEDFDPLFPGARTALDRLSARDDVLLGIATGKARRGVDHLLKTHALEGRFVTIQTADTSPSKPHPDMVMRAMAETGAMPDRTVMIGDTGFDMEMARAAGVHALGVAWGYHDRQRLISEGAQGIAEHFDDLSGVLDALLATGA